MSYGLPLRSLHSEFQLNRSAAELYTTTGLAVVYTLTKLRCYLLGKHFSVMTDHHALCVLSSKNPTSPRLRRWAVLLKEFDYDVVYTKGSLHEDIDCLSRAPVDDPDSYKLDDKVYALLPAPIDADAWISLYVDDESKRFLLSSST